ncbi:MAG: hypothetical protein WC755_00380 [Candidatus Woesearchaeota archaeon]|jgi:hypothetical protein
MAVTDIIIALGIIAALALVLYMSKEVFRWDRTLFSAKGILFSIIGFFVLVIVVGRIILTTLIQVIFDVALFPLWIFLGGIVGLVGIFYFGKLFRQW